MPLPDSGTPLPFHQNLTKYPDINDIRNDIKDEVDKFLAAWVSVNLE